jgi:caa(3)-type oxidase subunit IV
MSEIKLYVGIWAGLVAATVLEVVTQSLPGATSLIVFIIVLIASVKAIAIALYYQHLHYEGIRIASLPIAAIVALTILAISAGVSISMGG